MAQAIAVAVGSRTREDGYVSGPQFIVSWCIGHLVALASPQAYDTAYQKWRLEDLPIVPAEWKYEVNPATKQQLDILQQLMHRPDVDSIICATDAGREGELIFRLVYDYTKCTKPVKRLWISSMEESAILDGLQHLKDDAEYDHLYEAALCRQKADWLVGMNGSRLFSLLYGTTLQIGRVLTPTLALIANRESSIQAFQPEKFYTVQLRCGFEVTSERMTDKAAADAIRKACQHETAVVKAVEQKHHTEQPPRLYDLTTLQRDANRLFGYSAQQTLDFAQALYEKKLLTYPRTDSQYLTEDTGRNLPCLVQTMAGRMGFMADQPISFHPEQIVDDSRVTDHHAILPIIAEESDDDDGSPLPTGEQDILFLVMNRPVCSVSDPYEYDETAVTVTCAGYTFTGRGKHPAHMGWKAIDAAYRASLGSRAAQEKEEPAVQLPELTVGQELKPAIALVKEGETTPPRRYTEDTLLSAMEHAGAADMPDDAERKGLGTPATRAGILEKLVEGKLIERSGRGKVKALVPTEKGMALSKVIPEVIQSPIMTAQWEQRLKRIERGEESGEAFLNDIIAMLRDLVKEAKPLADAVGLFPSGRKRVGTCPACSSPVSETDKGWFCENRACRFGLWKDNRFFSSKGKKLDAALVTTLLKERKLDMKNLYSERTGKTYDALISLETEKDGSARFTMSFPDRKGGA